MIHSEKVKVLRKLLQCTQIIFNLSKNQRHVHWPSQIKLQRYIMPRFCSVSKHPDVLLIASSLHGRHMTDLLHQISSCSVWIPQQTTPHYHNIEFWLTTLEGLSSFLWIPHLTCLLFTTCAVGKEKEEGAFCFRTCLNNAPGSFSTLPVSDDKTLSHWQGRSAEGWRYQVLTLYGHREVITEECNSFRSIPSPA